MCNWQNNNPGSNKSNPNSKAGRMPEFRRSLLEASTLQKKASGSYASQVQNILVLAMGRQKHKQPETIPSKRDEEDSSTISEEEAQDVAGHNAIGDQAPQQESSSEGDCSDSDPEPDDAKPPEPKETATKAPTKATTLKRSRCDDAGTSTPENARPSKRLTKETEKAAFFHESYNESSGDCTILAGKTYFKISWVLLTRPSEYFRKKLADAKRARDGQAQASRAPSNDKFQVEMEETPEDVGALHWLLTAFPSDIMQQGDPSKADLPRLISILYMANKYQFLEHEKWAKAQLQVYFATVEGKHPSSISSACYKRLYALASSIWPQFKCSVRTKWLSDLDNNSFCSKEMLDFAESMNDRFLQAHVYYHELLQMKGGRQDTSLAPLFHENNFTPTQNIRLYRGFWSLWHFWAGIRTPELKESMNEDHRDNCTKHWTWMWEQGARISMTGGDWFGVSASEEREVVFDPMGALDRLIKLPPSPSTSGDAKSGACDCRFQTQAKTLKNRLQYELADHFFGPVIDSARQ
ncbi:hypothetical protein M413DRAFT_12492 [Hebeloma cylindrosporum]|uniref:BTB domain-containing protein n=1 Tax=Hebeloma cylindrosporum TaxID=76867 RepID=A0A0C3C3K3_HEBCY|nr:hypothetical protein M413DRAFT_12492 [Hebeloma cylindrosporum h7]